MCRIYTPTSYTRLASTLVLIIELLCYFIIYYNYPFLHVIGILIGTRVDLFTQRPTLLVYSRPKTSMKKEGRPYLMAEFVASSIDASSALCMIVFVCLLQPSNPQPYVPHTRQSNREHPPSLQQQRRVVSETPL